MLSLWTLIFIWAPCLIFNFFFTFILIHIYGPAVVVDWTPSNQRYWHLHHQDEPSYVLSDEFETPHWILWLIVLITVVTISFGYSRFPQRAKEGLLYSMIANMLFIRYLSTFSGWTHYGESMLWFWFPWDTRSHLKGFILASFVKLRVWDRLWWGAYSDSSQDTTLTNLTGNDAPSIPSQDATVSSSHQVDPLTRCIGCAFCDSLHLCDLLNLGFFYRNITDHYKPVPWRDAMIRLAFYHVLDNIVVVLQLRFSCPYAEGAPYTTYVNNSEIATWVLVLQVYIWKLFRMREGYVARLQKKKAMTEEC
jgi:hypothetical protein